MAGIPRSATQTGTRKDEFRTGQNTGQCRSSGPYQPFWAELSIPSIPVPAKIQAFQASPKSRNQP